MRGFWTQTPNAEAQFKQTVLDSDGETLSESGGRLWFARGGKFRVEYDAPEQLLLVSDGESFWSYEADLKQALVRPLSSLGGGFLAALSASEWGELPEHYKLSAADAGEGLRWVTATTRASEDSVREIRFGFDDGGELRKLNMRDSFGGEVRIEIANWTRGASESRFVFAPPPGTEVVADE